MLAKLFARRETVAVILMGVLVVRALPVNPPPWIADVGIALAMFAAILETDRSMAGR